MITDTQMISKTGNVVTVKMNDGTVFTCTMDGNGNHTVSNEDDITPTTAQTESIEMACDTMHTIKSGS